MDTQNTLVQARQAGKLDESNKMVGGFAVARMSSGTYDWFPAGQPPNVSGTLDQGAQIVEKWFWNYRTWRKIA